jgi:hypothetical protein
LEEFTFPQDELQERPSTSSDPSHVPQGDQKHLIQRSKLNHLLRDLSLSNQQAEILDSRLLQWNFVAKGKGQEETRKNFQIL